MATYFGMAKNYGFTPSQVDEMDLVTLHSFAIMNETLNKEDERRLNSGRKR